MPAARLRSLARRLREAGPLKPTRKSMPRQQHPDAIALEYFKSLRKRAVDPALAEFAEVRGEILRLLVDLREEQKRGDGADHIADLRNMVRADAKPPKLGTRNVSISALSELLTREPDPGRLREAREKYAAGETPPPIIVAVGPDGGMEIIQGSHRLTVARERGEKTIPVRFVEGVPGMTGLGANPAAPGEIERRERERAAALKQEERRQAAGERRRSLSDVPQGKAALALVNKAARAWAAKWRPTALHDLAARFGEQTSTFQRAQLDRQIRAAVGVSYASIEKPIRDLVPGFARENVSLVKSVPDRYFGRLADDVEEAFAGGMQAETLAERFAEREGIALNDARRLANDQILTLAADVNQARQESLGVTQAVWHTMGDGAVCPVCEPREGMTFDWDDPPDGCAPGHCHPGDRCFGAPILDGILNA